MGKYHFLSERFYKFFKYLRTLGLVSLVIFLGVTAFNRGNPTLSIISYVFMIIMLACLFECIVLYVLHIILKNK